MSHNALACALCPLIPLPLIDVFFKRRFMREIYRDIARSHGHDPTDEELVALSKVHSNLLVGCLLAIVWYPIKKIFKTFLYVFTVKECFDWGAEAVHRGWMVHHAYEAGVLPGREQDVWNAMHEVLDGEVHSPIGRLLRGRACPEPSHGLDDEEGLSRLVDWLHHRGGGAILMKEFERRIPARALEE